MSADGPFGFRDEGGSPRESLRPPAHPHERERLATLDRFEPFAFTGDPVMVSIAGQATNVCDAPVGFVSFLEANEERFIACVGYQIAFAERSASFCGYTILEPDVMVVEDTRADPRFRDNPFVVDPPHIRFYAGAPILAENGLPLGAVCVIDYSPREVSSKCLLSLRVLASLATSVLEIRRLFAGGRSRESSEEAKRIALARLDDLLLTLVAPRSL